MPSGALRAGSRTQRDAHAWGCVANFGYCVLPVMLHRPTHHEEVPRTEHEAGRCTARHWSDPEWSRTSQTGDGHERVYLASADTIGMPRNAVIAVAVVVAEDRIEPVVGTRALGTSAASRRVWPIGQIAGAERISHISHQHR